MMHHVWVDRLKVASADTKEMALYYAEKYREEGRVVVKRGNKIVAVLSKKGVVR